MSSRLAFHVGLHVGMRFMVIIFKLSTSVRKEDSSQIMKLMKIRGGHIEMCSACGILINNHFADLAF